MTKEVISYSVKNLTAIQIETLLVLRALDETEFNGETGLYTLGQKFNSFNAEPLTVREGEEREQMDDAIDDLCGMGYIRTWESYDNGGILEIEFTETGKEITDKVMEVIREEAQESIEQGNKPELAEQAKNIVKGVITTIWNKREKLIDIVHRVVCIGLCYKH